MVADLPLCRNVNTRFRAIENKLGFLDVDRMGCSYSHQCLKIHSCTLGEDIEKGFQQLFSPMFGNHGCQKNIGEESQKKTNWLFSPMFETWVKLHIGEESQKKTNWLFSPMFTFMGAEKCLTSPMFTDALT